MQEIAKQQSGGNVYGLMAEFSSPEALTQAAREAAQKGFTHLEAFSPFPVEGLSEILRIHERRLPFFVLMAGLAGCVGGFLMQYYASVISYPIVVGGKPLNSWPAFIPVTFELTILCAAGVAVFGMILLNGLPSPYHPVFNGKNFSRATYDRFFLCVLSDDPHFDPGKVRQFLTELKPESVEEVLP